VQYTDRIWGDIVSGPLDGKNVTFGAINPTIHPRSRRSAQLSHLTEKFLIIAVNIRCGSGNMKVGVMAQFGGETSAPDYVARMARGLEERGFHSVWAPDHILVPKVIDASYPYQEDGEFPVEPTT
jgi:hypothetical protein